MADNKNLKDTKKELFSSIWKIANQLRGSVDGWDFKQYIFAFLFYRYISEKINKWVFENQGIDYETEGLDYENNPEFNDSFKVLRDQANNAIGYFIKPSDYLTTF